MFERSLRALRSKLSTGQRGSAPRTASALDYVSPKTQLGENHRVQLLAGGGEAFPAMLAAIAGARKHVHLETYILRSDKTGERFHAALLERARAGVRVRLMYDSLGSYGLVGDEFLASLASAGVEIVEYHPVTPWRRRFSERLRQLRGSFERRVLARPSPPPSASAEPGLSFHRRDHQKILVVDDEIAFTGGLNIGDEYAPAPEGGGWHDLHVRIEGPAVLGLADAFRRAWLRGRGEPFSASPQPAPASARLVPALAHTCDNFGLRKRASMHAAYRHALHHAHESIGIFNAYFIPDALLRRALFLAVARGVCVRVIVPAKSDVTIVAHASRYLFDRLLSQGVRIFEFPDRMMHAKAGVIDATWATIGSFNLDRRSMLHNLEAGVVVIDGEFGRTLAAQFELDLAVCREVTLAEWRNRPLSQRFLEWAAHLFAYWL